MSDSTSQIDQISSSSAQKEILINALADAMSPSALFGRRASTTTGLTWGYYGGDMLVDGVLTSISNGTVALTGSTTNYVEATRAGVVSKNTTGFTAGSIPLYTVVTNGSSQVTSYTDNRITNAQFTGRLSKSVAGSSDVTLTAAEARNNILHFTGTLTGNINVIVPAGAQIWAVNNSTSGAFSLTVKTSAGTGVAVAQSTIGIVYADGTNVVSVASGGGGTPAGSSTYIQYNSSGSFGAEAAFTYDSSTNTMTVDNITIGTGATVPTPSENDNDTSVASTAFVNANITGAWSVKGNRSGNNSSTPNTQFDLVADTVVLRNTNNHIVTRFAPSTVTNNISTTGPAAGGRDQSGSFGNSVWVYFYWIWNGSTLSSVSSLSGPTTGPTLPSGYTHWAYCCTVRIDGSGNLLRVKVQNTFVNYELDNATTSILSAGTASSFTGVTTTSFVPTGARGRFFFRLVINSASPGGFNALVRPTGSGISAPGILVTSAATQVASVDIRSATIAEVDTASTGFDYYVDVTPAGGGLYVAVNGYYING